MMQKSAEEAEKVAEFYDYIEVQPPANYSHLIEKDLVQNEAQILDIINKLIKLGDRMNKKWSRLGMCTILITMINCTVKF